MLHSSNKVDQVAMQLTMQTWRTSPDSRFLARIEFVSGNDGDLVDFVAIGDGLAGQAFPARPRGHPTSRTFLQIEPAGTFGNKDLMNSGMSF